MFVTLPVRNGYSLSTAINIGISVGGMVMFGALASLDLAWSLADMAMGFMTICNLIAITLLGKYAFRLLEDYRIQKRNGIKNPVFTKGQMKDIENDLECW